MATQTGKRFVCAICGSEMLVTRAGDGALSCCGQPMQPREAPPRAQAEQAPARGQHG